MKGFVEKEIPLVMTWIFKSKSMRKLREKGSERARERVRERERKRGERGGEKEREKERVRERKRKCPCAGRPLPKGYACITQ